MPELIVGIPLSIVIMWGAGMLYALSAISFLILFRQEIKNELMTALFSFLLSMAFALILMGAGEYLKNMIFGYLGTLAILIGSVFMLKFPLTFFSEVSRRTLFQLLLGGVLLIFVWMVISEMGRQLMPQFIMWYMIIVSGIVVGFFIFFVGLRSKERAIKIKATGGGLGVASCCVVSHVASMSGAILLSAIFQFLAPILLILSLLAGRYYQRNLDKLNITKSS